MDNKNELSNKRSKEKLKILRLSLREDLVELEQVYSDLIKFMGKIESISEVVEIFNVTAKEFILDE